MFFCIVTRGKAVDLDEISDVPKNFKKKLPKKGKKGKKSKRGKIKTKTIPKD